MKKDSALAKSAATRAHILETSLKLFDEHGFEKTSMRDIATAAGISTGLAYRYFTRKEELLLEFYARLAQESVEASQFLPKGTMAKRFAITMTDTLDRLSMHRDGLGSLFGVAMNPSSGAAVLGDATKSIRLSMLAVYESVVSAATDSLPASDHAELATLFYSSHMLLVLFWLIDSSPDQRNTRALVLFAEKAIKQLTPFAKLPPFKKARKELCQILSPMFGT